MSFEKTKKTLEKIIKKPKITIALLERPPFKFIVDIVSNVIESTGYLKDDFSKDELKNAGKDKESKGTFLEKLIKILDDGSLKDVKASKIMSGIEAEETNKMLYRLGSNAKKFAENGAEGTKKKKKDKNGDVKDDKKKEKKEEKKDGDETPKTKKRSSRSETREKSSEKREKEEEKTRAPSEEKKKKKTSSSKERHKSSDKKEKKTKTTTDDIKPKKTKKDPSERHLKRQDSMIAVNGDAPDTPNNDDGRGGDEEQEVSDPIVFNNLESSQTVTVEQDHREEEKVREEPPRFIKQDDMPPLVRPMTGAGGGRPMTSMGRPGTAASRPAPPKLKKKQIATIEATPQVAIELKSEIISDSVPRINIEEDDAFIMENDEDDLDRTARVTEEIEEEDRGALVQKIMETKAGIEDSATVDQEIDLENDKVMSVEREKVKQLQEKLQDLTRAAYPLARMFDFASDDIESMVKEMERWRTEQRKNEQEDQNRKATGLGDSTRLYNIIANLQKEIQELKDELAKARGRVLNNEKKISLLISNY